MVWSAITNNNTNGNVSKEKSQGLYASNHLTGNTHTYFSFSTIICSFPYLIRCSKFKLCRRSVAINTIEDLLAGQFALANKQQQQLCIECHAECSRSGISGSHETGTKGNKIHRDISPRILRGENLGCMKNKENLEAFAELSNKDQECRSNCLGTSSILHFYRKVMKTCSC